MEINNSRRLFSQTAANTKTNYACCIKQCKNYTNTSPIDLFPLPRDLEQRAIWCKILGIPKYVSDQSAARVCALHFRSKTTYQKPSQSSVTLTEYIFVDDRGSFIGTHKAQGPPTQNDLGEAVDNTTSTDTEPLGNCSTTDPFYVEENFANLDLECDEDVLSTAQLNAYMKELMAFISANELVHRLPPAVPISQPIISSSSNTISTTTTVDSVSQSAPSSVTTTHPNSGPSLPNVSLPGVVLETRPTCITSLSQLVSVPSIPFTSNGFAPTISTFSNSFSMNDTFGNNNALYTIPASVPSLQPLLVPPLQALPIPPLQPLTVPPLQPLSVPPLQPLSVPPLQPLPVPLLQPLPVPPSQSSGMLPLPILKSVLTQPSTGTLTVASTMPLSSTTMVTANNSSSLQALNNLNVRYLPQANNSGQYVATVSVASTPAPGSSLPQYIRIPLSTLSPQSASVIRSAPNVRLNVGNSSASSALLSIASSYGNSNYPLNNGPSHLKVTQYGNQLGRPPPYPSPTQQLQQLETVSRTEPCGMPQNNEAGKQINQPLTSGDEPLTEEILPLRTKNDQLKQVNNYPTSSTNPSSEFRINLNCDETMLSDDDLGRDAEDLGLCNVATVYGTPPASETVDDELEEAPVEPIHGRNVFPTDSSSIPTSRINNVVARPIVPHNEMGASSAPEQRDPDEGNVSKSMFNNSMGPVIVDVISAIDGANEYFDGDKIPEILLDKNRRNLDSPTIFLEETSALQQDTPIVYKTMAPTQTISIFSLQDSIPVLPGGLEKVDVRSLFTIKCPYPKNRVEDAGTLRMRLRKEKFIQCSVWWLIQRKYMPLNPPCTLCGYKIFTIDRNKKFFDGYCWTCSNRNCRSEEPIKRPSFFERFKFCTLEDLLLLTFHWACQSSLDEILLDVKIDSGKIGSYFRSLQELCNQVSIKRGLLGSDVRSKVEVSAVKLGHYFILGAMDRKSRYTRLEVLTPDEACRSAHPFTVLEGWLHKNAVLLSEKEITGDVLPGTPKYSASKFQLDNQCQSIHTQGISKYLSRNLIALFGRMNPFELRPDDIKGFLYELQWRGKYGKFVDMAFWSILNHIRELNPKHVWQVVVRPGMLPGSEFNGEKMEESLSSRWGPMSVAEKANPVKVVSNAFAMSPFLASNFQKSYSRNSTEKPFNPGVGKIRLDSTNMSELFQDIPEIPGGSHNITSKALLAIKICCQESKKYNMDALYLGVHLKTEGFIKNPVKWLVKKSYISSVAPCYVCSSPSYLRENLKSSDGSSWMCQNNDCKFENVFKRPQFFARFQYPMAHIAAMIFHWTVQSDINIITSDAPMDSSKISHAWRSFQVLCSASLKRDTKRLGGTNQVVEVALVQFGKLYILGAMERNTQAILLKAFPTEMNRQIDAFYSTLSSWVEPHTTVVVNSTKNFSLDEQYNVVVANPLVTDMSSATYHVLNVTSYLLTHISNMFGHLRSDMVRQELVQIYLDELMWRERHGKKPQIAFKKIMDEIFYTELQEKSLSTLNHTTADEEEVEGPEDELSIICLKEVRVVLRRIPKTVLKYYNCLPPDDSEKSFRNFRDPQAKASSLDSTDSSSETSDSEEEEMSSDYDESASSQSSSSDDEVTIIEEKKKKEPVIKWGLKHFVELQNKQTSNEAETKLPVTVSLSDVSLSDISLDGMLPESPTASTARGKTKETPACVQNPPSIVKTEKPDLVTTDESKDTPACIQNSLPIVKTEKPDLVTGTESEPVTSASTSNVGNSKRRVQPLVIKMNKKRLKMRSYLKSEFAKRKHYSNKITIVHNRFASNNETLEMKKELRTYQKDVILDHRSSPKVRKTSEIKSDCVASGSDPVPAMTDTSVADDSDVSGGVRFGRRRPVVLKRVSADNKPECIECGEFVTWDHYMKQFSCTDCKKSVYTTCCPKAFFEHRGSLLFGKRSRRSKTNSRLHRPVLQKRKWFCPCGYSTNQGNRLAFHMVKCNEPTCYL